MGLLSDYIIPLTIIICSVASSIFISRYFPKHQSGKKILYTFEICKSDPRNYELLFNLNNELFNNNEGKILLQSQQAEALQYFEKIAVGLKNKLLDEQIIFDCYGRYFILAHKAMKYVF
jgi:hypothetical protein